MLIYQTKDFAQVFALKVDFTMPGDIVIAATNARKAKEFCYMANHSL